MATKIRNGSPYPITLPYPLRGILGPGKGIVVNVPRNIVFAALGGVPSGGVADFGGLEITEYAAPSTAAFDNFYLGDLNGPSVITAAFANWYIDPANGDDSNDGLSLAKPLKTCARRRALWGATPTIDANAKVTVNYLSANPTTDPESFNVRIGPGAGLTLQGTMPAPSKTGTFQSVTTAASGTNTPWSVTDAVGALGAADVGKLIRITGGARAGAYALVVKDNGASNVRTSEFGMFNGIGNTVAAVWTSVTPQAADPYEVLAPITFTMSHSYFERGSALAQATGPTNAVVFDSLLLNGGFVFNLFANVAAYIVRGGSRSMRVFPSDYFFIVGGECTNTIFASCGRAAQALVTNANNFPPTIVGTGTSLNSGGPSTLHGGALYAAAGCIVQGGGIGSLHEGLFVADDFAIFDTTAGVGLLVHPGAIVRARTASRGIWGANNTGYGVQCYSGGIVTYRTKPNINVGLGAGREANVGGTDKLWSAIPFVEPANNAMIVVEAP